MNNWLDRLERRYGRYKIPDLMLYITSTMLVLYLFQNVLGLFPVNQWLSLVPSLVLRGQVWRLITFVFLPPSSSILTVLLMLYFYYFIGSALESHWGSFRFNVYYLCGVLGTIVAAMITGYATNNYLNMSLFLAFAALFPEEEVLLFFVIPMKVKYLAYLDLGYFAIGLLFGSWSMRAAAVASLINFFLFFGPDYLRRERERRKFKAVRDHFRRQMNDDRRGW